MRDDVEEKIGENEQSELTLSLFPSSKQRDEKKPQSNERERERLVPNSCLSLASQEIGHMSNPTITREGEETKK